MFFSLKLDNIRYKEYNQNIMNLKKQIFSMAKQDVKKIVFPEASSSDKTIEAVRYVVRKGIAKAILIGDESALYLRYSSLESENLQIINPKTSDLKNDFAKEIFELRKEKGMTKQQAEELAQDPIYFSTMLVKNGYADAMVSGAESNSADTFKAPLQLIKGKEKDSLISSIMLYMGKNHALKNKPILISDCALVENPTAEGLVEIAKNCVDFWKMLFIEEPKVAFLSYSTNGSAKGDSIDKVRKGAELFKKTYPYVIADGEMQLDCAIMPTSQSKKNPDCKIKGDANIFIVPDINSGNLLGKSIHHIAGLTGVGPITQGFKRPISDMTRNSTIEEIVLLIAITAIQAQLD
ncbi:MAG: phosphate acyltransferase [Clostridia bacterium]|nr:phosphate acyltransferase [Clostridia bacterium]